MSPAALLRAIKVAALAWAKSKAALEDYVNGCVLRGDRPDPRKQSELTAAYNTAERALEAAVAAIEPAPKRAVGWGG